MGDVTGGQLAVTPSVSYRGDFSQFEFPNPLLDQEGYALVDRRRSGPRRTGAGSWPCMART